MKTIFHKRRMMTLTSVVLAAGIVTTLPPAVTPVQSQSLFEKLFPRAAERRRQRLLLRQQQNRALNAVEVKKVAAPKYYNYKAAALKEYGFGKLAANLSAVTAPAVALQWVPSEAFPADYDLVDGQMELQVGRYVAGETPFSFAAGKKYIADVSVMTNASIAKAVRLHYENNPEFLWVDKNGLANFNARSALSFMEKADSYGLVAGDYKLDTPEETDDSEQRLKRAIDFELSMSATALMYAADAAHGKVNPNKLSGYHDFPANKADYEKLMTGLATSKLPMRFLSDSHPQDEAFSHMRSELAKLRGVKEKANVVRIASGLLLKPGMVHDQVPNVVSAIKQRGSKNLLTVHEATLAAYTGGNTYDDGLVKLVKGFQSENKLGADGIVGRKTIAKLQGVSSQDKINKIVMAMERLRWHPTKLGNTHVFINQPAYRATYIKDGASQLSMRAIVGKKSNQTSFFHDTIETVVFNPYWGIPRSILVNEYLPKLRANPAYLDERGYELTNRSGVQVASSSVDWWGIGDKPPFDVRQPPGPKNALGEVKILFPNKHAIYMHDTPSRSLFKRSSRALSHGCVRLHKPKDMAAAVLGTSVNYVQKQIDAGQNKRQSVKHKIPVYVAYFTAWPNAEGEMKYFPDIYDRDRALSKAIAVTRKVRDSALTG